MAEIHHPDFRNFFTSALFQYVVGLEKFLEPGHEMKMCIQEQEVSMRYLKYFALLAVLMLPVAYSQAQVRIGIGVGVGPAVVAGPPVCSYGYYDYYPYACAPYGYYAPDYFVNGVFIGAGPWYHWGHPAYFWNRGYARGWDHDHFYGRVGREYAYRGNVGRGYSRGYSGGGFHGGQAFRGGGEFHGRGGEVHGGGFHGGRR